MWRTLLLAAVLLAILQTCLGQSQSAFQWKFNTNSVSTSLVGCSNYPILVQSRNTSNASALGTPPYYMIAFNPGGVATTSFIGSDPNNLTWTVNQSGGSSLVLSVIDSQGLFGGQPPALYTVQDNSPSSCVPKLASGAPNITIAPNFTSPISTCSPMGMLISGGKAPYNLTLAALNSPVLTNVTMGPTDDVFTYINRADPGSQILAAVVDANGFWSSSTQLFTTTGSKDTSCTGLVSSSGNSTSVNLHPSTSKGHSNVAVAVIVPLICVALAAGGFFFWRRRKSQLSSRKPGAAILPEAWMGPSSVPGAEHMALKDNPTSGSKLAALARYRSENPYQPLETGDPSESATVIQHRDAGDVHEIPPPYFDRNVAGPSGASGSNGANVASGSRPLLS
ncbi:hypothetical protein SCHPADRAFT_994839 [Schizopora paradoxa]|uniref:Mid2 domain-containing protein n=1 Tax=Schizopora paradoxa TaxID=27342 RepID=A0A0H2SIG4_9AGAM|nr:hypothetical protein SCHPADRAFT_994839 [Schizopora paradoxa]